jgi:pyruvate/2-oxoglutarate/acetoin dehydrogenase E1 component
VKTFREAIAEAIREEMLRDKNVFLIGVEVGQSRGGTGGVLKGMAKAVGQERIVDTPLAEAVVVGVAAGAAMVGMRPVAELLYGVEGRVPDEEYLIPIGKADIKREGKDVTIIATGIMVHEALGAAEKLEKEGIEAEILDPRTLLPVDRNAILKSVEKTGRVVITHRATKTGGIGAEFAAIIAEEAWGKLKVPIKRVTAPDTALPWSPPLRQFYLPNADSVVKAVKEVMECR